MGREQSLPVLMPTVPGQHWSCHSCTACCRTLVGHLTPRERAHLDEQGWAKEMPVPPYVKLGRGWALNKHPDGACVFLRADGLCDIHVRYGEAAKPLACRIYPFSVRPVQSGWRVSLRFDCPSMQKAQGRPIGDYREWLRDLANEMAHTPPPQDDGAELATRVRGAQEEVDRLIAQLVRWIRRPEPGLTERVIGAARLTEALEETPFRRIRGRHLEQVVETLLEHVPRESVIPPQPPGERQRGMLRQLAFAHAEHVSHAEMQSLLRRWRRRREQLRSARQFRVGTGTAPRLPGVAAPPLFEQIEAVAPCPEEAATVENLVERYLLARLEGHTVCGAGYYGWPVLAGLNALWLSVVAVAWLGRYHAAAAGRDTLSVIDMSAGLGWVDRAATRLPSLGTLAERLRVQYLMRDDGIARLLGAYRLLGSASHV
ncbi:MAG TPA: YkgJ family cysteine cluster protein [Phycisphaerae bacterium]|nr:YkgJ family cysteine cluster protein [Phycisphaerae bacterium]HNU47003.1 YkgJ family cysteine cluster protein [Phycisphaerae bacterium]